MEFRILGKTGLSVSVLGFGGAEIGLQGIPADTVEQLLNSALDAGLNLIDTAECYADSEEKIGQTVKHRRGDFYLFTKCGHASGIDLPDWDPRLLEQQIDRSLKRLQTDHLDLVQLHSCSEEILRQGDAIAVLQAAQAAGKTRFIGYSGDNEPAHYALTCGAFDTLQTSISIVDQSAIETNLPLAKQHNIGVIVKRPIANAVWRHAELPDNSYVVSYWERLKSLDYDFAKAGGDTATSAALHFTLALTGVHTAIVGTTHPERWSGNAALLDAGAMPSEQFDAIRARWQSVAEPNWVGQT